MTRLLALEWDDTEARIAVASLRTEQVVFEHAFSVPLGTGAEASEAEIGERIAAGLAARRVGRIDALVGVGRSDVELRTLSLPPAPDDELPELARFQAIREFNELEEDWPLDFLPLNEDPEQSRSVLAAAINPALVATVRQTCHTAGLKANRLILRPGAAASLLCRRSPPQPMQARLLVDLLVDEVDLTAMIERKVIFLRRARLVGDPLTTSAAADALLSEIRRTIPAVQTQLGGRRVESVVFCGATPEHTALAESFGRQLAPSVEVFDPMEGLRLEGDLERGLPDHPARFAALFGMLLDELEETPHAFDFLNPRRRPEPPSRRNTYALAGLVAASVALVGVFGGWLYGQKLENDLKRLTKQSNDLEEQIAAATEFQDVANEIDRWAYPDVNWLEELHRLSTNFPSSKQAMLTDLRMLQHPQGGEVKLQGLASDVQAIEELEKRITSKNLLSATEEAGGEEHGSADGDGPRSPKVEPDASRVVVGKSKQEDTSQSQYPWGFSSSLVIKREKP